MVMRIGSESTPETDAEASTTTTPFALASRGAMNASISGQPFFSPGCCASAVIGTAVRPVRSTVRSVPPGAVTRAIPASLSICASRWARGASAGKSANTPPSRNTSGTNAVSPRKRSVAASCTARVW